MKINFQIYNLNDGHTRYWRNVYTGRRDATPLASLERQRLVVGPIFKLAVSGTF